MSRQRNPSTGSTYGRWNQVPEHAGWYYGLCQLDRDGSLFGRRTVDVFGPDGEQFTLISTDGWASLHKQAHDKISELER